ncbi:MAG TPA: glycoside hydrolase family 2 TIM barrel-domain containing protein [Acidobacteriaceae bacterium]|nr:glycoside hydrolase family 2 TIM barrel-domain containing protein [Acidobacteriaceae bacterium]
MATRLGLAQPHEGRFLNNDTSASTKPYSLAPVSGLVPVPASVNSVATPVIDLGGTWKFLLDPPAEFWRRDLNLSQWSDINVPGEFATQGFSVVENTEYPCRRKVQLPPELKGHKIFVRFDGVYGYARVWVNGTYVRDHFGGFTSWECEITQHVEPGQEFDLVIGITDRSDDISQASYYAKHSIAGVLRKVRLIAVPDHHLTTFSVSTMLDSQFENGSIQIDAALSSQDFTTAELRLELTDAAGIKIPLDHDSVTLSRHQPITTQTVVVGSPKLWDSEHPNLYALEASLLVNGKLVETLRRSIGFRVVERKGNQLLVNGLPVRLRGVCRHSIHPIYGRAVPPEFDEMDATLFRDANINFVRTSHYPPTEEFLAACDRHGIYVEEETAVCWSNVVDGPSSNPEFTQRFLSQFREMVERDREHPAVLFWSLGNESQWGSNFAGEYSLAHECDSTRPLIFSYPDTVPWGTTAYDIYSKHYADVSSDVGSDTFPMLNDEFAHVSCYNVDTLRRDPGVRNFWGESISRFGNKFLTSDGCLGGSIWAGIDEVFLLPGGPVGYGPWGLIDGWRRQKPEYWLTKKAYSPVRIHDNQTLYAGADGKPQVPVFNAFDHTNFVELEIRWKLGEESGRLSAVDIAPRCSGLMTIPAKNSNKNDLLDLQFLRSDGSLVDHFRLPLGPRQKPVYETSGKEIHLENGRSEVLIKGSDFVVTISRATGLITHATCGGQLVLEGGPYLNLGSGLLEPWLLTSFGVSEEGGCVVAMTAGQYGDGGSHTVNAEFEIRIDGGGLIATRYRILGGHEGYSHLGISYRLPENVDKLSWDRLALWSIYPDDHIGRQKGVARRKALGAEQPYRSKPQTPWSEDMGDVFLFGKDARQPSATNDFMSLKEYVWYASCILSDGKTRARVEASADVAVTAYPSPDHGVLFTAYNYWSFPDLTWGNYTGTKEPPAQTMQEILLRLTTSAD